MMADLTENLEPVKIVIDGTLDLHHFSPKEVPDLLNEYFLECIKEGIFSVKIIHGKGKGILKARVHSILEKHDSVKSYAQTASGNWGATMVTLIQPD